MSTRRVNADGCDRMIEATPYLECTGEIGEEKRVQVPDKKGVAKHVDPESCVVHGEVWREAVTGERIGQTMEPR